MWVKMSEWQNKTSINKYTADVDGGISIDTRIEVIRRLHHNYHWVRQEGWCLEL